MFAKKIFYLKAIFVLIGAIYFMSCRTNNREGASISLSIVIHNQFGQMPLALQTPYTTLLGEQVRFTRMQYYLSNFKLHKGTEKTWAENESYHIIRLNESGSSKHDFKISFIPKDNYDTLEFSIGIDSVRNSSGMQTGALDPIQGMFWTWSTGYIFMRNEGFFMGNNQVSKAFVYHIGSNAAYRTLRLAIPARALTQSNPTIEIVADFQRFFGGFQGASIDLRMPTQDASVSIMGGSLIPLVANNYATMFRLK